MTSPSPHPSPAASLHESESLTLERLITHFVAAKRSLSATSHVYRANEIVDTARSLVEECAVLGAKNAFLERGVNEEANALTAVRAGLDDVAKHAHDEFTVKVDSIDIAYSRLLATLDRLKETIVDASLATRTQASFASHQEVSPYSSNLPVSTSPSQEPPRTLYDFIDESGHENLRESLKQDINDYNNVSNTFQATQTELDSSLSALANALAQAEDASPAALRRPGASKPATEPEVSDAIPDLFDALTTHATETASLLQSLIGHYDLCSTALKHTEGGGEAARAATESTEPLEGSLFTNKHHEPITADEKAQMLTIVETDAQEVDDVVYEIRERLSEMEAHLALLQARTTRARTQHRLLATVLDHLHDIGAGLAGHVVAARTFTASWTAIRGTLDTKSEEIHALDSIYEGFLSSYSLLLKEVARRSASEARIQKVMDDARRKVDRLTQDELLARKGFFEQVSDFLPRDIWGDLETAPKKWEWVGGEQPGLRTVLGLDDERGDDGGLPEPPAGGEEEERAHYFEGVEAE